MVNIGRKGGGGWALWSPSKSATPLHPHMLQYIVIIFFLIGWKSGGPAPPPCSYGPVSLFLVKRTHTIFVLKHVFHSLTLFLLHIACKLKGACSKCTPDYPVQLCYPGDAASKYRMARVAAPCLLCIEFLHPVMLLLSRLYFRRKGPRCCDCCWHMYRACALC